VVVSASVDEALRAELEAVRDASRAGEIVALTPDDDRSMARYLAGATLRLGLFVVLMIAAIAALLILFP
jgi:hypothetical protein